MQTFLMIIGASRHFVAKFGSVLWNRQMFELYCERYGRLVNGVGVQQCCHRGLFLMMFQPEIQIEML